MEEDQLQIVNYNTKSRIGEGECRPSNLDLMFCSIDKHHWIEYEQLEDSWSDHFPIIFDTKLRGDIYIKKSNRISSVKTDWNIYRSEMTIKEQ